MTLSAKLSSFAPNCHPERSKGRCDALAQSLAQLPFEDPRAKRVRSHGTPASPVDSQQAMPEALSKRSAAALGKLGMTVFVSHSTELAKDWSPHTLR